MLKRAANSLAASAWALLIIFLPVTSMPLIKRLVGSDSVAAPSGFMLLVLVLVWLAPWLLRGGKLPAQTIPLFWFALAAFAATVAAVFWAIPPFKDVPVWRTGMEALVTVAIGLCFFLAAAVWPSDPGRLQQTLRLINWSGLVLLIWALVQAGSWYALGGYPDWMRALQDLISTGPLYKQRPTAFALEPSWLAHQLNMLYLPYWLASSVMRSSAHRWRLWKITLEDLLLAAGAAVLYLSLSRVGLLAFLLTIAFLLVRAQIRLVRWLKSKLAGGAQKLGGWLVSTGLFVGLLALYLAAAVGLAWGLSRVDPRMQNLFNFSFTQGNLLTRLSKELVFAERVVYWQAGWETFNDHPLLGVGLGNAGFFFPEKMSGEGWRLVEVHRVMFRAADLPNIKSFWVRLLAETGLVGFAFFLGWSYVMARSASWLRGSKQLLLRTVGLMGLLALIAYCVEGFSVDSFALPYYWISLGLVAAACGVESGETAVPAV